MKWYTVFIKSLEGAGIAAGGAVGAAIASGTNITDTKTLSGIAVVAFFGAIFKAVKNVIDGSNPGAEKKTPK